MKKVHLVIPKVNYKKQKSSFFSPLRNCKAILINPKINENNTCENTTKKKLKLKYSFLSDKYRTFDKSQITKYLKPRFTCSPSSKKYVISIDDIIEDYNEETKNINKNNIKIEERITNYKEDSDSVDFDELPQDAEEIKQFEVELCAQEFCSKFLIHEYSHSEFFKKLSDHKNIEITEWTKDDDDFLKREIKFTLEGIPFVNDFPNTSTEMVNCKQLEENKKIVFKTVTTSGGFPMVTSYYLEEIFEIINKSRNKCSVRMSFKLEAQTIALISLLTKTVTKTKLINAANGWVDYIREKGYKVKCE